MYSEVSLDSELGANGVCDGVRVMAHRVFRFCFDHDSGQCFGAAVANDDAPGILQLSLGGVDCGGYCWNPFERLLLAYLHIHYDLRKDLQVRSQFFDAFSCAGNQIENNQGRQQSVAGALCVCICSRT
jgi:hypothetical protein